MLRREAALWLARLQGDPDPGTEAKFRRWYESRPANADAFERVKRSYGQAGLLRESRFFREEGESAPRRPAAPRRPRVYARAAATALILLVPAGAYLIGVGRTAGEADATMLKTRVGEIRQVRLKDGSKVTLDTSTTLQVRIGDRGRQARLDQGRARFEVAGGPEPFVVEAGSATVTARKAVFDVERAGSESQVEIHSGLAEVRSIRGASAAAIALGSGEGVAMSSGTGPRRIEAGGAPDWTRGMLEFDSTPLRTAVALANPYSDHKIIIDNSLGELRVTGAFRAGDTTGLAKALAAAFHLTLKQDGRGNMLLSPSTELPADK